MREAGKPRTALKAKVFATDAEAVAYLRDRVNVEAVRPTSIDPAKAFRLDRVAALLEALGNPQADFKSVHVAGSKGKGSVCEMVAAGLGGCGHAVGLFTSPHLMDVRERIRVGGQAISPAEFTTRIAEVAAASGDIPKALGEVSYFEILTAAAFLHFAEQAVDLAVVEVGLGGRHDATNVILPAVCAITAIQPEHVQLLGPTLEDIAGHKAGIMKPGVPALSVPQVPSVEAVLRTEAQRVGCPLAILGKDVDFSYRFETSADLGSHTRVGVTTPTNTFEHVPVPLRGDHQSFNCAIALAIIDRLAVGGLAMNPARVLDGLAATPTNGRLELVHAQPRVFVDGAHTPDSIRAVVRALSSQVRYDAMTCIFGCAADKDSAGMLKALSMGADKVIFTRAAENTRAADPKDLHRKFAEASGKSAQIAANMREAIQLAGRGVGKDDIVVVTGSFAVAGEAKRLLTEPPAKVPAGTAAPLAAITEVKPSGIAPSREETGE